MRIYSSILDAVKETERELFEMGIDNHAPTVQDLDVSKNSNYDSKELIGYGYSITEFEDKNKIFDFFFEEPEASKVLRYSGNELTERLSHIPLNPGKSWMYREDYWKRFLHDGKFSYTYSERMHFQLYRIIEEMETNPSSRQCVVTIYDSHEDLENLGGKKRIPCSMYYHFLVRNISGKNRLQLIYTMRSCDFYTHFPVDVWIAVTLGLGVGNAVNAPLYSFTHFISSLHAFRKDFEKRRIF